MKNVYLFLADGFEEIEALATVDILRRAGVRVVMVSVMGSKTVSGAHGVSVQADAMFDECSFSDASMLVLPGGMPGAANLGNHVGLCSLLNEKNKENIVLAAICAAPMVFGELGLLEGKKATCYPGFETHLKNATYTGAMVECAGNIVTAKGPAAVWDFAYTIAEKLVGTENVNDVKAGMLFQK